MKITERERSVLLQDICKRLGEWGDKRVYNSYSESMMKSLRDDAQRLADILDARELEMYRAQYGSLKRNSEEEG